MASFKILEHTVRAQHTRDRRAGAQRGRENELKLHVKQYIPNTNTEAKPGDVTIIGAQANGTILWLLPGIPPRLTEHV